MTEKRKVGFIGLGDIGRHMATHLVCDQFEAYVFDLVQEAVDALVAAGANASSSVAELARTCSYIGVCVNNSSQVESVLLGEEGVFANADKGTMVVVHSTVTQAELLQWVAAAAEHGITLIDVPMTGGASRSEAGTLCYMAGGTAEDIANVSPVLETSAEKIVHAGPVGSGIALKLCNNFMQYTSFTMLAEAARLADACGLSLDVIAQVGSSNGVVDPQSVTFVNGRNGLAPACTDEQMVEIMEWAVILAHKDLDACLATAAEKGVTMPTAEYIRDRIENVFYARDESRPPAQ